MSVNLSRPDLRVVIADADPSSRSRARRVWTDAVGPSTCYEAGDGTEALALCREHRPPLLITEILLEGPSGLALLRQLRAEFGPEQAPRVIFVTNFTRESDRYWALRNGAYAYLNKPCEDAALRERLDRWLAGANPERPE